MTLHTINGIANLVSVVAVLSATVIGIIAIGQQGWPWWQVGLAWCGIALVFGVGISALVTSSDDFKKESQPR